jgi:pyridoxamine 5'-phosphate oxidase
MVLLRGITDEGLRFFTNYESAEGDELAASPRAAVVIYWREMDRQVRARGAVERLPEAASDEYFASRPRESQLGAWASPQSEPLGSREELDARMEEVTTRFEGARVERPTSWGGFVLRPDEIEFWQGQVARLHDRFRYRRAGDRWTLERLAP